VNNLAGWLSDISRIRLAEREQGGLTADLVVSFCRLSNILGKILEMR